MVFCIGVNAVPAITVSVVVFVFFGPIIVLSQETKDKEVSLKDFPVLGNVSYGDDPEQLMDIYPPMVRNETTPSKVILVLHGGAWKAGRKENVHGIIPTLRVTFPHHIIATMNYRWGTPESPAFPKQVEDIGKAINHIKQKKDEYKLDEPKFGLIGLSAGGHLALLYSYASTDREVDVSVVCNIQGPTYLYATYYTNPAYSDFFKSLVGNVTYAENPEIFKEVSPVSYVGKGSAKTIAFFGAKDRIVPEHQGAILEEMLDRVGVYNKFYTYADADHMKFTPTTMAHMLNKLVLFFKNYL